MGFLLTNAGSKNFSSPAIDKPILSCRMRELKQGFGRVTDLLNEFGKRFGG